MDYPILRALAGEWDESLRGAAITDCYTQDPRELTVEIGPGEAPVSIRVLCAPHRPLVWRSKGTGRARRNTASVLQPIVGQTLARVRVAHRDRHILIDLDGGQTLQFVLFGPRPNVLLVDARVVIDAFLRPGDLRGMPAPDPSASWWPSKRDDLRARWDEGRTNEGALLRAMPTLGRPHAREAIRRAGLHPEAGASSSLGHIEEIADAAVELDSEVEMRPAARVYVQGREPLFLSLVAMTGVDSAYEVREFASVDDAARAWAALNLAAKRSASAYEPLAQDLQAAANRLGRTAAQIQLELGRPSRADLHERNAHLLMAAGAANVAGASSITVRDVLAPGDAPPVAIELDPALTLFANAERLYERARHARKSREHAAGRGAEVAAAAARAHSLLAEVRALEADGESPKRLEAWCQRNAGELAELVRSGTPDTERLPYRRFILPGGWEVRVGRGASDNLALTTRHASPHDYWLHARGVPGSHVVLRRPARDSKPPRAVIEAAAGLAAWFSKARTQALVPVSYTERKYVRPVKGGRPGLARLDREEVVVVEPLDPSLRDFP